jgi:hypothetical protein
MARLPGSTDSYQRRRAKKSDTKKATDKHKKGAVKKKRFAMGTHSVIAFAVAGNNEESSAAESGEESETESVDNFDNQKNQGGSGLSDPSFIDLDPIDITVDEDNENDIENMGVMQEYLKAVYNRLRVEITLEPALYWVGN